MAGRILRGSWFGIQGPFPLGRLFLHCLRKGCCTNFMSIMVSKWFKTHTKTSKNCVFVGLYLSCNYNLPYLPASCGLTRLFWSKFRPRPRCGLQLVRELGKRWVKFIVNVDLNKSGTLPLFSGRFQGLKTQTEKMGS